MKARAQIRCVFSSPSRTCRKPLVSAQQPGRTTISTGPLRELDDTFFNRVARERGHREECPGAGMSDYLSKPITNARLVEALARHLPAGEVEATADGGARSPPVETAPDARTVIPVSAATYHEAKPSAFDPLLLAQLPMVADGSQPEMALEVLDMFMAGTTKALSAIEKAVGAGDAKTLLRTLHTLKSSSAQVGALAMAEEARRQETALRSGMPQQADWSALLRAEYARFEEALARHRQQAISAAEVLA